MRQAVRILPELEPREICGRVAAVRGLSVTVRDLPLPVGAIVRIDARARTGDTVRGEVVGFAGGESIVMLFNDSDGIAPGVQVVGEQSAQTVPVGSNLLGRVINGRGRVIDGGPRPLGLEPRPLYPDPTSPLARSPIREPLPTGVRAVDAMLTLGKGQRIGIFSGPGIGKSTLLASIAQHTTADVNVIALIGERGREVREFLEETLGPEGRAKSVLVISTSDESPLLRVRAAAVACTVAEHFRDGGRDVMLMMDSITRFAQAQRQIGLTINEQPATKGYPPSVFALMPKLLERAGTLDSGGSITGLYSVLVEGDDLSEPISDAARGILDGHIALSRRLAARGRYPAVDLLESISRVADDVCDKNHIAARRHLLRLLAAYAEAEELINIGAYARGSNPDCDVAIEMKADLEEFLGQSSGEPASYPATCRRLIELALDAAERSQRDTAGRSASPTSA
ncbi:MAG: FliI/YscN family ATPase [Phycisphaerales bacterium]|nr:FliI/YscN family ATPase [Phycisphaerae bacterium]NNF44754.1 FliI/YscN family ATPase [Phycisphaerales bacterium]NNM27763.1 FliI/YscN family ATPase [Phycisphaerales bacterium]